MNNENTAFLFPGMGVKPCGHEAEFYHRHAQRMMPYLVVAGDIARTDFVYALTAGKTAELSDFNGQVFTYAFSCSMALVLKERGIVPGCAAGYSAGIYAALHCAGAVTFTDGLKLMRTAYRLMERSSAGGRWGMAAVIGLRTAETAALIGADGGYPSLHIANVNSETCQVVNGEHDELQRFLAAATAAGAVRAEHLGVAIPYHHPCLAPAAAELARSASEISWRDAVIPVISAVNQQVLTARGALARYAAQNLSSPLNWQGTMEKINRMEISQHVECGPGTTLARNARFLGFEADVITLRTLNKRLGA